MSVLEHWKWSLRRTRYAPMVEDVKLNLWQSSVQTEEFQNKNVDILDDQQKYEEFYLN